MRNRRSCVMRERLQNGGLVRLGGATTLPIMRNLLPRWV
jgi:hypothetical protein